MKAGWTRCPRVAMALSVRLAAGRKRGADTRHVSVPKGTRQQALRGGDERRTVRRPGGGPGPADGRTHGPPGPASPCAGPGGAGNAPAPGRAAGRYDARGRARPAFFHSMSRERYATGAALSHHRIQRSRRAQALAAGLGPRAPHRSRRIRPAGPAGGGDGGGRRGHPEPGRRARPTASWTSTRCGSPSGPAWPGPPASLPRRSPASIRTRSTPSSCRCSSSWRSA